MHICSIRLDSAPTAPRWPPALRAQPSRIDTRYWKTRAARGFSWQPGGIAAGAIRARIVEPAL